MSDINNEIIDYLNLEKQVRLDGLKMMDKSTEIPQRLLKEVSIFDRWIEHLANGVPMKDSGLHLQRVMPMLLSIAKCFDDYLEDLDPKDDTEELSEAVEMMKNIADDNSMFIRN